MTAKEKQTEFIKTYLKPTLKQYGYLTAVQTWWKDMGDFLIIINLQNSSYNDKDKLSFCFNIGIGITSTIKDPAKKKIGYNDMNLFVREDGYLPKERQKQKYRKDGWLGYLLTSKTEMDDFTNEFKIDFEENILKNLNKLKTLEDCKHYYSELKVWGKYMDSLIEQKCQQLTPVLAPLPAFRII